jgi:tRNA A37 threonylcarbamoyladenosine dehydratase
MDSAHLERFAGIGRLYGRAGMERLAGASFMIVGLGGVGSWTAEALARSGVGHLALVDGDSVCVSNTNRQLHAVAGNVGKAKTTAVAERARAIHPAIRTTEHTRFLSRFNPHEVLAGFDGVVIDAMDALSPKCGLIAEAVNRKLPVVTVGGCAGRMDGTRLKVTMALGLVGGSMPTKTASYCSKKSLSQVRLGASHSTLAYCSTRSETSLKNVVFLDGLQ